MVARWTVNPVSFIEHAGSNPAASTNEYKHSKTQIN